MMGWLGGIAIRRGLLALAALVAIIVLIGLLYLVGAFNTYGTIFVGSPEVYTRERLVNDRYDQDFWLHNQLALLDQSNSLVTSVVRSNVGVGAKAVISASDTAPPAAAPPAGGPAANPPPAEGVTVQMPFDQEFLIRAGVRDAIRQLILENLLDDRHDLTGNSVYGLKFDMTVLAASRTYDPAFVRVSVKAKELFSQPEKAAVKPKGEEPAADEVSLPEHVKQYFEYNIFDIEENQENPLYTSYSLYNKWIADVDSRLNTYEMQIYEVLGRIMAPCATDTARVEWERRVLQAANDVLGLSNTTIQGDIGSFSGTRVIRLPDPWRNHLQVTVSEFSDAECQKVPVFHAEPIWDPIYLISGTYAGNQYMLVDKVDDTTSAYVSSRGFTDVSQIDSNVYETLKPHYKKIGALANYVKNHVERKGALQSFTVPQPDGSKLTVATILVPSGYFNFIESVFRTDSYTYALFPKTEVFGVLAEQNLDIGGSISAALAGKGSGSGNVSISTFEKGFKTSPRAIGFTEATATGSVEFGWVIGGEGRLELTQKSGLALVSVPAWTNELSVQVETGWVSPGGSMTATGKYDFAVPIPPDYEAFDAFVGGSRIRHEPRISNDLMGFPPPLEACDDVSLIIPGFRLWRSTVVTLGDQTANRITVLPNMRGIVARFDDLLANSIPNTETMAKLRVWTSEGVDTAMREITILPPASGAACLEPPAPPSGDNGAGDVAASAGAADRLGWH